MKQDLVIPWFLSLPMQQQFDLQVLQLEAMNA